MVNYRCYKCTQAFKNTRVQCAAMKKQKAYSCLKYLMELVHYICTCYKAIGIVLDHKFSWTSRYTDIKSQALQMLYCILAIM